MAIVTGNLNCSFEHPPTIEFTLTRPLRQNFSFPDGIIHYISFTPSSAKGYQKLLESCKYFVFKKYILITDNFYIKEESIDIMLDYLTKFDVLSEKLQYKLWLNRLLTVHIENDTNIMTKLLNNTYQCNLIDLKVSHQNLTYEEYLMLVEGGKIKELGWWNVVVTYSDGKIVPFENLMEKVPNIVELKCSYTETSQSAFTSKTAENLSNLPKFDKLKLFRVHDKYPKFNALDFCDFIKKTDSGIYEIFFSSAIIDEEWFKIFETKLENSKFVAKKRIQSEMIPFSKSNNYHNLTSIKIQKQLTSIINDIVLLNIN